MRRVTIMGTLFTTILCVTGQAYATFISQSARVSTVTITTASELPTTTPTQTTRRVFANADSELYQHSPEKNMGTKRQLNVISRAGWNSRLLLKFDLASIPNDATIRSCQLHLHLSEASNFGSRDHGVFRVVSHSDTWGEGAHRFSRATTDENSWQWFAKSDEWTTFGGDIADTPTAITVTGTTNHVWRTWDVTPDCVPGIEQSWILRDMHEDNPNYTIRTEYQSRESFYTDEQPHLDITYQLPLSS